jgi:rod shape-determining protein MreC
MLVLLSAVLMTADHRQHYLEGVRAGLSLLIYPVQVAVNLPFQFTDWATSTLRTHQTLRSDLLALQNENMRLRELLESSFKVGDRVLIAELLRVNMEPYTHQVVLNKGSKQDVFMGQPVIDANGIMGQVIHLGPLTSTAMLITDPNHALPVQVSRNGLRGIAVGTGGLSQLELLYIPPNADIQPDDLLVTSGLGGRFPPGYPVARITAVTLQPGMNFARVTAEPMARLQRNQEVLLVWPARTDVVPPEELPQ